MLFAAGISIVFRNARQLSWKRDIHSFANNTKSHHRRRSRCEFRQLFSRSHQKLDNMQQGYPGMPGMQMGQQQQYGQQQQPGQPGMPGQFRPGMMLPGQAGPPGQQQQQIPPHILQQQQQQLMHQQQQQQQMRGPMQHMPQPSQQNIPVPVPAATYAPPPPQPTAAAKQSTGVRDLSQALSSAEVLRHHKRKKPTDRSLPSLSYSQKLDSLKKEYEKLVEMEKTLDATCTRKKAELMDESTTVKRTTWKNLRIRLSNTCASQEWQEASDEAGSSQRPDFETGKGIPSWTVNIEGKLMDVGVIISDT